MALTSELLKKQEVLSGLTEDQIKVIETLSANEEKEVINTTFGKIHSELDVAINEITGVQKNPNEKTSDYMKRMLSGHVQKIEELNGSIKVLEDSNAELKKKVDEGISDEELKKQLGSKDATIAELQKKYSAKADEIKALKEQNEKNILDYRISSDLQGALAGIEFAEGTNEAMKRLAIANAMATVKGMNPTYVAGSDGVETLVFKDANGAEMLNPDNAMNRYTAAELIKGELVKLGVVSTEARGGGAGGRQPGAKQTIVGAKTRSEAIDIIESMVASRGIKRTDEAFQKEVDKIYDENYDALKNLPM